MYHGFLQTAPLQRLHVLVALTGVQPQRLEVQSVSELTPVQLWHFLQLCSRHGTAQCQWGDAAVPPQPTAAARVARPSCWSCLPLHW